MEDVQLIVILFPGLLPVLHKLRPCHFELHLLVLQLQILEALAVFAVLPVLNHVLEGWRQLREKILRQVLVEQEVVDVHHLRLPQVAFHEVMGVERVHHAQLLLDLLLNVNLGWQADAGRRLYVRLLTGRAALVEVDQTLVTDVPVASILVVGVSRLAHVPDILNYKR